LCYDSNTWTTLMKYRRVILVIGVYF
jgi:hypothetical protein